MGKLNIIGIGLFLSTIWGAHAQQVELSSPDNNIKLSVSLSDGIYYTVSSDNAVLMENNAVALHLKDAQLGKSPKLLKKKVDKVSENIHPVVPLKFSTVKNEYNRLLLSFKGNYAVEFRVFDDGLAYRFITNLKDSIEVYSEDMDINFPQEYLLHLQQPNGFKTAYEEPYSHLLSGEWKDNDKFSTLPVLIDTKNKHKILVSEADLTDYPCMFVQGTGGNGTCALFPKAPLSFGPDCDRSLKILEEADYIAKTAGSRAFPWRYFVIAKNDAVLIENTMTLKLAAPSQIKDPSWIKPGQVSWEWWNDAAPYGPDVDFVSGYNLDTYKYYIDFAAKFGIPYILMDEGWAKSTLDPFTPNPKVDVHELIRYGKEKNVGIVLWLTWLAVENHFELFKTFKDWGIKGVKIDFMDRSDQWMVNYYERVAREAAAHELFVDFHGSFKPAGLEYKYPNVLSYEGVRGMEQMGGCYPDNSIFFPFMRNAVGPMDYTPGAMISMQPEAYAAKRPNAASIGTRAYQLALFVIFESGIQMLADNPTLYYRNEDCTQFITQVPTTWDETKALVAEAGEVVVVAKRKGNRWFIGGMTNVKERTIELSFDFLDQGKTYSVTSFEDGINADRQAMDYRRNHSQVKHGDKFQVKMVRNGGWAAVLDQ
ncbi:glycoside hydrolase family 97 protein [Olivibacter sitiensis]|uniref:glycoside hydrolase family 97 protein n=1 Tax=Olivibacter sitiensis TaxID=376470 RepID=UPI0003FE791B|nr:glycoside hydrolase family 97 protein [Olivibacter sitiensis]